MAETTGGSVRTGAKRSSPKANARIFISAPRPRFARCPGTGAAARRRCARGGRPSDPRFAWVPPGRGGRSGAGGGRAARVTRRVRRHRLRAQAPRARARADRMRRRGAAAWHSEPEPRCSGDDGRDQRFASVPGGTNLALASPESRVLYRFPNPDVHGRTELLLTPLELLEALALAVRVDDPNEAIARADIIITATNSSTPVFDGSRVELGTHVTGVGSYMLDMCEVDTALVTRARVIVDQREAVMEEAGDIVGPIRDGVVDETVIVAEIGEVVMGRVQGRTADTAITFFKSVGNAVQDVAVAARVLTAAEAEGRGLVVDL